MIGHERNMTTSPKTSRVGHIIVRWAFAAGATLVGVATAHAGTVTTARGSYDWSAPIDSGVRVYEPGSTTQTQPLNFPLVSKWTDARYPQGVLWAAFNVGIQDADTATAPVVPTRRFSTDGGATWQSPDAWQANGVPFSGTFGASNAAQRLPNGPIVSVSHGSTAITFTRDHVLSRVDYATATSGYVKTTPTVRMDFETLLTTQRSLLVIPTGTPVPTSTGAVTTSERWLKSAYGKVGTVTNGTGPAVDQFKSYTLASSDLGQTWTHTATIDGTQGPIPNNNAQIGPNEADMALLKDGTVLAHVRQGHGVLGPTLQFKSYDFGETWTEQTTFSTGGGLLPSLTRLPNDVLVASWGRRSSIEAGGGVWVAVDFTGTGDFWGAATKVYSGYGSEHTSVTVDDPTHLKVWYDVSDYGSLQQSNPNAPNYLAYTAITLAPVPEPAALAACAVLAGLTRRRRR